MLLGPELHILKLPNFFKAVNAFHNGRDFSNKR
jgi:hypothetical protein